MEEKKRISSGTVICLVIIILLIVALGVLYYIGIVKNNERINELEKTQLTNSVDVENKLGQGESYFCIDDITKNSDKYVVTAYLLKKEPTNISKSQFEAVINGSEIEFRNLKWKFEKYAEDGSKETIYIKSNEGTLLALRYRYKTNEGYFENVAGAAVGGLRDYSTEKIKFEIDKDILIIGASSECKYDENGNIKEYDSNGMEVLENTYSISDLQKWSKEQTGTYEECKAYIKDGKVDAIQCFI